MIILVLLLVLVKSEKVFDFRLPLALEFLSTEPNFKLSKQECVEDFVDNIIVPEDGCLLLVQKHGSCVDNSVISELNKVKLSHYYKLLGRET